MWRTRSLGTLVTKHARIMKTFTTEQYIRALHGLNDAAKDMILEDDTGVPMIGDVAKEFGLSEEQEAEFTAICVPMLYGLVSISEMPEFLTSNIGLSESEASRLHQRCKETFFGPVLRHLGDGILDEGA